jgi:hypothetical protein
MQTTGKNLSFDFGTAGVRRIAADFSAAHVTPDAGALLLTQVERKRGWIKATNAPIHGGQEGKYLHGYYDGYCYLPLYIFSGSEPLCAKLRTADHDGYHGALDEIKRIVAKISKDNPRFVVTNLPLRKYSCDAPNPPRSSSVRNAG